MYAQAMPMSQKSQRPSGRGARSADRPVSPSADPLRFASSYHAPVLAAEVVEVLVTDREGLYIDGTLGGGGHSAALLTALGPSGHVVGIDHDEDAVAASEKRLAEAIAQGRFRTRSGNFADIEQLCEIAGIGGVDGVLLDLGISSHQIDEASRGFAFSADGPLDMRMDADSGESAAELIERLDVQSLADLLRAYGEEPRAWPIANAIANHGTISTTGQLAELVRGSVPGKDEGKSLARVFQALRIAVNDEMAALERAFEATLRVLRPGGRLAVISYHSLEDRRAKHFLRFGNVEGVAVKDFYGNLVTPWKLITRRPIVAGPEEIAANPRSRSARLRIAEKLADFPLNHSRRRKT